MTSIVHPDEIHACGSTICDGGSNWRDDLAKVRPAADETACYGDDDLGAALLKMHEACVAPSLDYIDRTGQCIAETGFLVHEMARAYRNTEFDNLAQAQQIGELLLRLGLA